MKKFQVIKCKTCNKVFAACIDQHVDDEWKEECEKYLREGNSIVETVETIGNVFDDSPLNHCCGKPAVVGGTMKPTEQAVKDAAIAKSILVHGDKPTEPRIHFRVGFEEGYNEAISQMQPEPTMHLTEMSDDHFDQIFTVGFAPSFIKEIVSKFVSLYAFHTGIASYGHFQSHRKAVELGYDVEFSLPQTPTK